MTVANGETHPVFGAPGSNPASVAKAIQDSRTNRTADHGDFTEEQTNTVIFRHGVPRVARALANIATYMMADDHEVTDDWNLTRSGSIASTRRRRGRTSFETAVAAFGVFQGWGNDPAKFEPAGNNKDFLDQTSAMFTGAGPYPTGSLDRIEQLTAVFERQAR